jgi:hypothetical protein
MIAPQQTNGIAHKVWSRLLNVAPILQPTALQRTAVQTLRRWIERTGFAPSAGIGIHRGDQLYEKIAHCPMRVG